MQWLGQGLPTEGDAPSEEDARPRLPAANGNRGAAGVNLQVEAVERIALNRRRAEARRSATSLAETHLGQARPGVAFDHSGRPLAETSTMKPWEGVPPAEEL